MSLRHSLRILPRIRARTFATTQYRRQSAHPATTSIAECSPSCPCAGTPPDLDIDRKTPLLHTMAPYTEQVLICSGKDDWSSRIEDEESPSGDFIRGLKREIGRGGKSFDVCLFPFYSSPPSPFLLPLAPAPLGNLIS